MTTQFAGIDVGKVSLTGNLYGQDATRDYPNTSRGIQRLSSWLQKYEVNLVVIEANGGYEKLAASSLRDSLPARSLRGRKDEWQRVVAVCLSKPPTHRGLINSSTVKGRFPRCASLSHVRFQSVQHSCNLPGGGSQRQILRLRDARNGHPSRMIRAHYAGRLPRPLLVFPASVMDLQRGLATTNSESRGKKPSPCILLCGHCETLCLRKRSCHGNRFRQRVVAVCLSSNWELSSNSQEIW